MLPTATTNAPSYNINVLDKHKPSSTSSVSDDNSSGITNLLKEEEQYQCKDFLRLHHQDDGSTSSSVVDAICRRSVCRWIFDTIDCLKMSHETAFLAITNLDRYMSVSLKARCDRRQYQLGKYLLYIYYSYVGVSYRIYPAAILHFSPPHLISYLTFHLLSYTIQQQA